MRHSPVAAVTLPLMLLLAPLARADVRLPATFSDGVVLQRDLPLPVFGTAAPGEAVTVRLVAQSKQTKAGADGRWRVTLDPMKAGGPFELVVTGRNTLTVTDVLVGEVWLCSGQSNMAFKVAKVDRAADETAAADFPRLRFFNVAEQFGQRGPADDVKGRWEPVSPTSVGRCSAVAYFFGRDVHRALGEDVPVGLIVGSVGGTTAEAWTARDVLARDPAYAELIKRWDAVPADEFERIRAAYRAFQRQRDTDHPAAVARAKAEGRPAPPAPVQPKMRAHDCPSALWNGMIRPLSPTAVRGVIWYQGESNAGAPGRYDTLFPAMIAQWRRDLGRADLPFYFVQLPNYLKPKPDPSESNWAKLREAQRHALAVPNTGMAVTIELGEANDIHPARKQEVGKRLARWALAGTYGKADVVYSGPLVKSAARAGDAVTLTFDHVGGGLTARGGALRYFAVAGADGKFAWADARIEGGTVVVRSAAVNDPVRVRYAWADNPDGCNLYNAAGLPASPFEVGVR